MAARWTGMRMTGIALAGLCMSTATRAQVGYAGPTIGCYGVMCLPVISVDAHTVPGFTVPWSLRGISSSAIPSNRLGRDDDAQGDEADRGGQNHEGDQDDHGNGRGESHLSRFNPATVIYTGLAATALISFLNSSSGASTTTPLVESLVVTPTVAAPLSAHVEFATAAALVATTDLVTTPEPMTQTLMATGLLAIGMLAFVRRRRRSNG